MPTDYISHLEPGVVGSLPIAEVASTPEIVTIEIALSQAISLKRIADSLAGLTPEVLRQLADASRRWSYPAGVVPLATPTTPPDGRTLWQRLRAAEMTADEFAKWGPTPKTDDNPWIDWPGGECPVPDGTLVEVAFKDGDHPSGHGNVDRAGTFDWNWSDTMATTWGGNIVAYRIHKEPTE